MAEYTANPNVTHINQGVSNIEIDSRPLQNSGVVNSSGSYPLATGLQSSAGIPLGGSAGIIHDPSHAHGNVQYSGPSAAAVLAPAAATPYPTTSYPADATQVHYSTSNQPITGVNLNQNAELYQAAVIPANSTYEQHQHQGFTETHRAGPQPTHFVEEEVIVVVPPVSTLTYSDAVQVNYIQNPQSLEGRWRNRLNAITLAHNAHETQNGFYEKLLARHQFNLEQTGYVKNYFDKRADASRAYAKALTAMPKLYNNAYGTPIPQHGSLESVLERVADVNTVEASGHHKLAESLDLHNQQKFGAYHTHIKNAHSTLTEGHKMHTRRLGQLRNNADRSLNQWSSNASIPAGEHYKPTYDPWLRETRFLHHYTAYRNGLDEYNTFLEDQFGKTAESDVYRSNMLKAALIEVLRLQQSLTVHQLNTSLDTGIAAVDNATIGPDFHKYAYSSGLTKIQHDDHTVLRDNFSSNLPRAYRTDARDVNDDFDYYAYKKMGMPPPLHHRNYVPTSDYAQDVEHIGQLDMSSRKGSTKPYLWVLSKYGYLHQFNANKLDKPKMSIAAKYCNVSPADSHGDFKIDYKQPGLHTRHNFYVRAANQAEGQLWQQKIANAGKTATYGGQY